MSGAGTFAHVTIRILEKEYNVACPVEEKASLLASAELLNVKMREIRDSGKVVGLDRVAVMAALNLANELLKARGQDEELKNIVGLQDSRHARASRLCTRPGEAAQHYNRPWCSLRCTTRTKVSRTLNHDSGVKPCRRWCANPV